MGRGKTGKAGGRRVTICSSKGLENSREVMLAKEREEE